MKVSQVRTYITLLLKKSFLNKKYLDRIGEKDGELTYKGKIVSGADDTFTESDVTRLINYLWPSEYKTNFLTADNTYIVAQDNKIFVAKEGDS